MARWRVPLADVVITEEDVAVVAEVYRSGWLSMGPATEALEADFAAYAGTRHAVAVTSGTAALHLICLASGLGPGDEVIVPSMTFVATINAIAYTGATPVFADIAGLTEPWLSLETAAGAVTPQTKAIMTMTYGGHPGETIQLAELAADRRLILLEDAAHGVGTRIAGRHAGTIGVAGAFSFFSNKNLAVGEGGMAVTDDRELAERMRLLRSHGMTSLTWDRHRGHASSYDVVARGFNYRIDEARAALVRRRLKRLDTENARRERLDASYRAALEDADGLLATSSPDPGTRSAHHLFTVTLDQGIDRAVFRESLADRGIQSSVHYPPAHRFSIYADGAPELPLTDIYGARAVTLPLFATMTDEQQNEVLAAVRGALRQASGRSASTPASRT
jgi:dTDP-4-amino-4,6-dideoxygalactose transaminase